MSRLNDGRKVIFSKESCDICRIPAGEIEQVVVEKMRGILRSPEVLAHAVREVNTQRPKVEETKAISALQSAHLST